MIPDWTEAQSAAIQAIATVIALFIAVGVPAYQRHLDRRQQARDRSLQAEMLFSLIRADTLMLRRRAWQMTHGVPRHMDKSPGMQAPLPELPEPARIYACLDRIHLLGAPAANAILSLMISLDQFNAATSASERFALASSIEEYAEKLAEMASKGLTDLQIAALIG